MDCSCVDRRRSGLLKLLLLLTLPACAPKESGAKTDTATDDSSAGPGTSDTDSTADHGSTWTGQTSSTSATGQTTTDACGGMSCDECWVLDEQQCSCCWYDYLCEPAFGQRLDREQGCLEESRFVLCNGYTGTMTCESREGAFVDPVGACWVLDAYCFYGGAGWTLDPEYELCPELADYWTDPPPPC